MSQPIFVYKFKCYACVGIISFFTIFPKKFFCFTFNKII